MPLWLLIRVYSYRLGDNIVDPIYSCRHDFGDRGFETLNCFSAVSIHSSPPELFTPFSRPREKCKWLCSNYLHPIFIDFSRFLKKLFVSRLSLVPTVVPGLSHAFSGTQKSLKKGHLALVLSLVPPFSRKKVIFVSVCGVIDVICGREDAFCITKHVQTTLIQLCFRHKF